LLIVIILGGIYGGVFTPTEAAAVAAVYAFFAACFIYRDMGPLYGVRLLETNERSPRRHGYYSVVYGILLYFTVTVVDFFGQFGASMPTLALIGVGGGVAYLVLREGRNAASAFVAGLPVWGLAIWQTISSLPRSFVHEDTRKTLFEAGKLTIMLLFIIANALILKQVLTEERIPQVITEALLAAGFGPIMFLIVVNLLLLIGGQFMEPSGLIVIVAPLVFPIAMELGIDPIHLGIIMVVNMEIGMITPPVGLNLFVTAGVAGMSVMNVVRAALPWVGIMFLFLILVTYVPIISTWLPTVMMGPEIITN